MNFRSMLLTSGLFTLSALFVNPAAAQSAATPLEVRPAASTAAGQVFRCTAYFPLTTQPVTLCTVPAGRQLVIQTVSYRAGIGIRTGLSSIGLQTTAAGQAMMDFFPAGTPLAQPSGTLVYAAHVGTTLYADGGTAIVSVNDGSFSAGADSLYVTITGVLQ